MFRLLLLFIVCSSQCFSDRYLVPLKYDDQEEVLVQVGAIIVSNQVNSVSMYQTSALIENYRANFFLTFTNCKKYPINLLFSHLKAKDQWGRPIRVISKREQLENKEAEKKWREVSSALCAGLQSINAQNAGRIDYQSQTYSQNHTHFNAYGSQGWVNGSTNSYGSQTTYGTIHCEALRQQALRKVDEDAAMRHAVIQDNYAHWEHGLNHFYLDSTTVFPGMSYGANFQIEVPKQLEKELEYIVFELEVGEEKHHFCFYCGREVKRWYHFK